MASPKSPKSLRSPTDCAKSKTSALSPRKSPKHNSSSNGSSNSSSNSRNDNAYGKSYGEEPMSRELQQAIAEAEEARNRRLKEEIKLLEAETIRLERDWRQQVETEQAKTLELQRAEEQDMKHQVTSLNEELAEILLEREAETRHMHHRRQRDEQQSKEREELLSEIQVTKDLLAQRKIEAAEIDSAHKLQIREVDLEFGPVERDLRKIQESLLHDQRLAELRWEEEEKQVEEDRRSTLAKLDSEIKSEVLQLDGDIKKLMGAIEENEAKNTRLERLIKQYNSSMSF